MEDLKKRLERLQRENINLKKRLGKLTSLNQKLEVRKNIISDVNKLLDKNLYELSIINRVNEAVTSIFDHQQVLQKILQLLKQMIDYYACCLLLKSEEGFELILSINHEISEGFLDEFKERTYRIFKQYTNLSVPKEKVDINWEGDSQSFITKGDGKVNSFESLPLKIRGKEIGCLTISHSKEQAFREDDLNLLSLLASHSAIGIENALLYRRLERLAITDGLTNLYTHRYFRECLEKEIKRAERYNLTFSLLMIDIDDFKEVNDTYGYLMGDKVLEDVAQVIRNNSFRGIDVVARYGGEEFGVILPETNKLGAMVVGERIRKEMEGTRFQIKGNSLRITVSIGISTYPEDGKSIDGLIDQSDRVLYKAKKEGKNKVICQL
ncbi:MAG: diguanylate cyclase [bacterium]|nr:diguanylate cyclase [bacterium]